MEKLIFANIKMNQTISETKSYLQELSNQKLNNPLFIAFPSTSLYIAKQSIHSKQIKYGAQNVYYEENGAYTGEISAQMLKDLNCNFCIVGHSERRILFGETNDSVNKKIKALNKYGIKTILCVGENASQKNEGKTKQIIQKQIESALQGLYENELDNIIIAYEPVWSISTFSKDGKVATPKQVEDINIFIKKVIVSLYSDKASEKIKVLYGGSINNTNAKKYLSNENIDGVLVGGASLNAEKLVSIVNCIN